MGKESVYDRYPMDAKAIEWSEKVHGPRGKPVKYVGKKMAEYNPRPRPRKGVWQVDYKTRLGGEKYSADNPKSYATPDNKANWQEAKKKQYDKGRVEQFQTKGKKALLKGGGKSGGGGGKWGWNRLFRRGGSPWSLITNNKNF